MATTDDEVREEIRAACAASSLRKWAKANDLSPSYVSDVLKGARPPGDRILRAIGRERRTVYVTTEGSEA